MLAPSVQQRVFCLAEAGHPALKAVVGLELQALHLGRVLRAAELPHADVIGRRRSPAHGARNGKDEIGRVGRCDHLDSSVECRLEQQLRQQDLPTRVLRDLRFLDEQHIPSFRRQDLDYDREDRA